MKLLSESDFYGLAPLWAAGWSASASQLQPGDIVLHHGDTKTRTFQRKPFHASLILTPDTFVDAHPSGKGVLRRSISSFADRAAVFRAGSRSFIKNRAPQIHVLAERSKKRAKATSGEELPESGTRPYCWQFVANCYQWGLFETDPHYLKVDQDTATPRDIESFLMNSSNFQLVGKIVGAP